MQDGRGERFLPPSPDSTPSERPFPGGIGDLSGPTCTGQVRGEEVTVEACAFPSHHLSGCAFLAQRPRWLVPKVQKGRAEEIPRGGLGSWQDIAFSHNGRWGLSCTLLPLFDEALAHLTATTRPVAPSPPFLLLTASQTTPSFHLFTRSQLEVIALFRNLLGWMPPPQTVQQWRLRWCETSEQATTRRHPRSSRRAQLPGGRGLVHSKKQTQTASLAVQGDCARSVG
jgi:hypothetical protein